MEKQLIFYTLGIPETTDESVIRQAYLTQLKQTNPEDDPEGFKKLRQAYEEAQQLCAIPAEEDPLQEPLTEADLWIKQAEQIYDHFEQRITTNAWEKLFADPFCEGLDTFLEARERMIAFLMNHLYLPWPVWKLINQTFRVTQDRKELEEMFPENFLNYITYYIEHSSFIPYELFETGPDGNVDSWIQHYLDIKNNIDNQTYDNILSDLDALNAFGTRHPYSEVERGRYLLTEQKTEEALPLFHGLMERYPTDCYICTHGAFCEWTCGNKEEAYGIWKQVVSAMPDHYPANMGIVGYYMDQEQYYEARELLLTLEDTHAGEDEIYDLLHTANDHLIADWRHKLEQKEPDSHLQGEELLLELGWCLFQNDQLEDAIALLESHTPTAEFIYGHSNLFGWVLYQNKDYERALPYLIRWLEQIHLTPNDGTPEHTRRHSREGRVNHLLSGCYCKLNQPEEAEAAILRAIEAETDVAERLNYMQYAVFLATEAEQYEKAVDICDHILKEDKQYYPAYLKRQEAFYKMRNGQGVIDDYYQAIDIYAEYYKPYLLAAQTFYYYDQYNDAKGVIDRAKKNEVVFSNQLKLCEIKILRNLADSQEERAIALTLCEELAALLTDPESDLEDPSEVAFERALLSFDSDNKEDGYAYLGTAIRQNPDRGQYHMVLGRKYADEDNYQKALEEYQLAEPDYQDSPILPYGRAACYEGLKQNKESIQEFLKAIELQDGYRDSYERISQFYHQDYRTSCLPQDYEQAKFYLEKQLTFIDGRSSGEISYYLVELGRLYMTAYALPEAIEAFQKALTYEEDDWAAYNNMGCCYGYLGQYAEAIDALERSIACLGEDHKLLPYSNLADCYEVKRDYRKAIECYQKDLEWFPDQLSYWEEIGDLYCNLNEYAQAMDAYERTKTRSNYYDNIASVWYQKGNYRKAVKTYLKGIKQADPEDQGDHWDSLGSYYMDYFADYKQAIPCFLKAIPLEKDEYSLYQYECSLAKCYYMMGDTKNSAIHAQQSMEHFHLYYAHDPQMFLDFKAYRCARLGTFGWLYLCLGQTEKGLHCFDEMESNLRCKQCRHIKCYEASLYRGLYYEANHDYGKALTEYKKAYDSNPASLTTQAALLRIQKGMK